MFEKDNLIYDIGAHEGEDTAFYLSKGYSVVAVEANPALIPRLKERFSAPISMKKLEILQVAVVEKNQESTDFFVCDESGESSLYPDRLEEAGWNHSSIKVPAQTLPAIFHQYGKGYYCKMDIEGADIAALNSLSFSDNLPDYFSMELSALSLQQLQSDPRQLLEPVDKLEQLGYKKFKLVDQYTLATLTQAPFYRLQTNLLLRAARKAGFLFKLFLKDLSPREWYQKKHKQTFSKDSSGLFGEMLLGQWQTGSEMKEIIIARFKEYDQVKSVNRHHIFWVDLHAAR